MRKKDKLTLNALDTFHGFAIERCMSSSDKDEIIVSLAVTTTNSDYEMNP